MNRLMAAALVAGLVAAMTRLPAEAATTYTDTVRAHETSTGEVYPDGSTRVGHTFAGQARGGLPGTVSLTLNYQPPFPGADVTATVTGGNWSLSTARGEIFGEVTGGTLQWNHTGKAATATLLLTVTGGFGAYANTSGSGSFTGDLRDGSDKLRGILRLTF